MKIQESPALTRIYPVHGTTKQKINLLKEQIAELKQQKKCYDKMILERKREIKRILKIET